MNDGERLVMIASFLFPIDAYLLKMRLESEGIQCFLALPVTAPVSRQINTGDTEMRFQ